MEGVGLMQRTEGITKKASKSAAWIAYIVIIFEMIYMSTPFAVFFYSVYAMPLGYLNRSSSTSWLVQNVFPHFTQTDSLLISTLMYISWPLMGIGLLLLNGLLLYPQLLMLETALELVGKEWMKWR